MRSNPDAKPLIKIKDAAEKIGEIIQSILSTTKDSVKRRKELLDLNEVIKSELEILKIDHFFKHNVQIDLNLSELPKLNGIKTHFSQIFGNIMKNAADAMRNANEKRIIVKTMASEEKIFIEITDTGEGIPADIVDKIFEPLFTTKDANGNGNNGDKGESGTGLGLAYCKSMVEAYGGHIQVFSDLGVGTTFVIQLPQEDPSVKILFADGKIIHDRS